jgi:hypothetical protein
MSKLRGFSFLKKGEIVLCLRPGTDKIRSRLGRDANTIREYNATGVMHLFSSALIPYSITYFEIDYGLGSVNK